MGLLHSCILNVLPSVRLVAMCEKSSITRRFLKKVFNDVQMIDGVEKLAGLDLDAVYVTTPIPSHFSVAKALYECKVTQNVFVEKTLAWSYEEAKELCDLAHSLGIINMVGYLRRFCVTFRKAKDLLSRNAVGGVSSFKAFAYSSDFLKTMRGSRAPISRGGVLRDLGCHAIDLALWFIGELQVSSAKLKSLTASGAEDSVFFRVKNSSGLEGEFCVSWNMRNYRMPEVGLSITGSQGVIEVNDDRVELRLNNGKSSILYRHALNDNVPFWLGLPEYYREDLHFVKSVLDGSNAEPSFYAASKVDEIIDQVERRAGENGQPK